MGRRTVTFDYLEISPINTSEVYDVTQQTSRGEEHHTVDATGLGKHACFRLGGAGKSQPRLRLVVEAIPIRQLQIPKKLKCTTRKPDSQNRGGGMLTTDARDRCKTA